MKTSSISSKELALQSCFATALDGLSVYLMPPREALVKHKSRHWLLVHVFAPAVIEVASQTARVRRLRLRAGDLLPLEPGVAIKLLDDERSEWLLLSVHTSRLLKAARKAAAPLLQAGEALRDPGLGALCHEVRRLVLTGPLCEPQYLDALMHALLVRVLALSEAEQMHDGQPGGETLSPYRLRLTLQLIEEQLGRAIAVDALARAAGLSRAHFSRAFKKSTGQSPARFVLQRRIARARELLADRRLSLADIALATGFSSQAHFSSAFKAAFHATPAVYRDAMQRSARIVA